MKTRDWTSLRDSQMSFRRVALGAVRSLARRSPVTDIGALSVGQNRVASLEDALAIGGRRGAAGASSSGVEAGGVKVFTVDPRETAKLEADAALWWDEERGPFAPLHAMNPTRVGFIREALARHFDTGIEPGTGVRDIADESTTTSGVNYDGGVGHIGPAGDLGPAQPLAGLRILDVGCGGGILCESLARLGADVTGIDAAKGNIDIATAHAAKDPGMSRRVTYHATTAEEVAAAGAKFDAVVSLEVVEHVNDPEGFVRQLEALTDPGGAVFISTLNRTARSYALAILAAERVLGWVPPGTHEFEKFITPEELAAVAHRAGLEVREAAGMVYTPPLPAPGRNGAVAGRWSLSGDDLAVNYVVYMSKPK